MVGNTDEMLFDPGSLEAFARQSTAPPVIAFGGGLSTFLATLPGAAANFSEMLSLVRHGRRVLLRAQDGQPATFFVGDRITSPDFYNKSGGCS